MADKSKIKVTKLPRALGTIGETPMEPSKVKYDKLNPKPTLDPKYRYKQPLTGSPEGGVTKDMTQAAREARARSLAQRGTQALEAKSGRVVLEKGQGAIKSLDPKKVLHNRVSDLEKRAALRSTTGAPVPVSPKPVASAPTAKLSRLADRTEQLSVSRRLSNVAPTAPKASPGTMTNAVDKAREVATRVKDVVKPAGPSRLGRALKTFRGNAFKVGEVIKSAGSEMKAAREVAKAGKWWNPIAKTATLRTGAGLTARALGRVAGPIGLADIAVNFSGPAMMGAGREQLKADAALQDFENTAAKYRKLGIQTETSTGLLSKHTALLTGGPHIKISVPDERLAMDIAKKRIPKSVAGRQNFKKKLSDMSLEELSQVEVKRKK